MDISPSDDPSIGREAPMQRKLRMITSLFSRQNLSQASPTHLVIITLISPTALLPVMSSGSTLLSTRSNSLSISSFSISLNGLLNDISTG
jgi:hypothetical protein